MRYVFLTITLFVFLSTQSFASPVKNGFDLKNSIIPVDKILSGGPPRDGIPSIDKPKFIAAKDADFLKPEDRVIGVNYNGVAALTPFVF